MPSYKEQYPDPWLKSTHLVDKETGRPRDAVITIASVNTVQVYDKIAKGNVPRLAASIRGRDIRLLLNKTQCEALEAITGSDDTDHWAGARVRLSPGRAPNGKGTILISHPPAQAGAPAPVHGRPPAEPVHGRADDPLVHGRAGAPPANNLVHGRLDEMAPYVPGEEADEDDALDPKSEGVDPAGSEEAGDSFFFSVSNLIDHLRTLHRNSQEPMNDRQFTFITKVLGDFGEKDGQQLLSGLVGRECTLENPAGRDVGVHLWDILEGSNAKLIHERNALRDYCLTFKPKRK